MTSHFLNVHSRNNSSDLSSQKDLMEEKRKFTSCQNETGWIILNVTAWYKMVKSISQDFPIRIINENPEYFPSDIYLFPSFWSFLHFLMIRENSLYASVNQCQALSSYVAQTIPLIKIFLNYFFQELSWEYNSVMPERWKHATFFTWIAKNTIIIIIVCHHWSLSE